MSARPGVGARRAAGVRERRQHAAARRAHRDARSISASCCDGAARRPAYRSPSATSTTTRGSTSFTVVTAQYHAGSADGVIGVIGPTRMPYEKVISLVTHTSRARDRSTEVESQNMADYYADARRRPRRDRRRDQEGVSQAGDAVPPGPQQRVARRPRRSSRRSPRRTTCCAIRNKRAAYDRYGEAGLRGGAGGFHHVDLSEALNIFMRDLGGFGRASATCSAAAGGGRQRPAHRLRHQDHDAADARRGRDRRREDGHGQAARAVRPVRRDAAPSPGRARDAARPARAAARCAARSGRSSASS